MLKYPLAATAVAEHVEAIATKSPGLNEIDSEAVQLVAVPVIVHPDPVRVPFFISLSVLVTVPPGAADKNTARFLIVQVFEVVITTFAAVALLETIPAIAKYLVPVVFNEVVVEE